MSHQPRQASSAAATTQESADIRDWHAHWRVQGQPWRREPEPPEERRCLLSERRAVLPDVTKNQYPFGGITLSRADVEWLLATLEDGRGPVDSRDEHQRDRPGLDLRGANLRGADLSGLPLAHLRGGLTEDEWRTAPAERVEAAAIHLEQADLTGAVLDGALLEGAHLEAARLGQASLRRANLSFALAEGAYLSEARLDGASLLGASLVAATLTDAHCVHAALRNAMLCGADLSGAHLEAARLGDAQLAGKALGPEELARVRRVRADFPATVPGACLNGVFFDAATMLDDATCGDPVHGCLCLADVRWGGVNLAVVDWERVAVLGDERALDHSVDVETPPLDADAWLRECATAVRANRQLAVALQEQGLNEDAARYAYRAQVLRRRALGCQIRAGRLEKLGSWLFSWGLYLLGGYGYRMWRILAAYMTVVGLAALAYYLLGLHDPPHLPWQEALLTSVTAFHGRVFSDQFTAGSPQAWVTALEAVAGLVVESIFVGMLVQRFFGK